MEKLERRNGGRTLWCPQQPYGKPFQKVKKFKRGLIFQVLSGFYSDAMASDDERSVLTSATAITKMEEDPVDLGSMAAMMTESLKEIVATLSKQQKRWQAYEKLAKRAVKAEKRKAAQAVKKQEKAATVARRKQERKNDKGKTKRIPSAYTMYVKDYFSKNQKVHTIFHLPIFVQISWVESTFQFNVSRAFHFACLTSYRLSHLMDSSRTPMFFKPST
jgi:hypothetical protein